MELPGPRLQHRQRADLGLELDTRDAHPVTRECECVVDLVRQVGGHRGGVAHREVAAQVVEDQLDAGEPRGHQLVGAPDRCLAGGVRWSARVELRDQRVTSAACIVERIADLVSDPGDQPAERFDARGVRRQQLVLGALAVAAERIDPAGQGQRQQHRLEPRAELDQLEAIERIYGAEGVQRGHRRPRQQHQPGAEEHLS